MLAVEEAGRLLMIDCGGDAIQRLMEAGLDPAAIHALVLTHEHPDHVSGFPLLLEKLWLLERSHPLRVYGTAGALRVARELFDAFNTDGWAGVPLREWHPLEQDSDGIVFADDVFEVRGARVDHPVDTIGLRIRGASGAVVAYSADTAMTPAVEDLARDADVLVHEATGSLPGVHSSPEEAAQTAAAAGVGRLVLVHLPPGITEGDLDEARRIFPETELGGELGAYDVLASMHAGGAGSTRTASV
jgi:ribonuclease Z